MIVQPDVRACRFDSSFPGDTRVSIHDLARGFLQHLRDPRSLREWAFIMEALPYELIDAEDHPARQNFLNALWSASFGDPLQEAEIGVITELARGDSIPS